MVRADIQDIVDELGRFKPISQWQKIWRQMLRGCEVEERYERAIDGEKKWDAAGRVVKVRFIDRLKAIELLGRHINVKAFQQNEVAVVDIEDIRSRIEAGRAYMNEQQRQQRRLN
jgi:Terminase small subunit